MDVFGAHRQLIKDYDDFTTSLVWVRDPAIRNHLDEERGDKTRWPDPWISLNPNFRSGGTVDGLADDNVSHRGCKDYFRDTPVSRTF
ncbi:hypothetical protein [Streptomyces sp. NPDC046862]|uniref:hypothetical protein n=1 Tax=Streptomyces sp. NPDC046862 TaxID=3154603 RepID=UPI00345262C8